MNFRFLRVRKGEAAMNCEYCNTALPQNQHICPVCFKTQSKSITEQSQEFKQRHNIIVFMHSADRAEFYHNRVMRYLQPDRVSGNWYATSEEAFAEITA